MSEQAGRELDAAVAERVMGAKHSNVGTAEWMHFPTTGPYADCDCERHIEAMRCPEYSTSITAAWEVVSKMGLVLIENSGDAFGQPDEWNVQFVGHDKEGEPHWVSASASTVELAICLAALKAVEAGRS